MVTAMAQARRAGLRGIMHPTPPAVASRHLYVLFYICTWMWGQVDIFVFVFVKKNSLLGTITPTILITLNYYYPYLLPVAPVYFDILLFMLKLCCVALSNDRSFSIFISVWNDRTRLESHRQTHIYTKKHIHIHTLVLHTLWSSFSDRGLPIRSMWQSADDSEILTHSSPTLSHSEHCWGLHQVHVIVMYRSIRGSPEVQTPNFFK